MDWERATQEWVEEGLIEPGQRAALQRWLETRVSDRSNLLDTLLPGLVAVGTWLVTGSAMVVLGLVAYDVYRAWHGWILLGMAAAQLAIGALARAFGVLTVSHGVWAAGWVVAAAGVASLVEVDVLDGWATLVSAGLLLVVGGVAGVVERMPGLCWAATVGGMLAVPLAADADADPRTAALVVGCLAVTGAVTAGQVLSERLGAVGVLVVTPTLIALIALVQVGGDLSPTGWSWLGSGLATATWGTVLIVASALSRSRWVVAATIGAWAVAEACVLFQVGSPVLAAAVLGTEGLLLFGVVAVWMVARAGQERRAAARGEG
ncbi:MAG: hypothetical protein H6735_06700 [Alphaproteobacteria bacterium]|nr:hypothetical protein [Alphaproteobacteria bacterium]